MPAGFGSRYRMTSPSCSSMRRALYKEVSLAKLARGAYRRRIRRARNPVLTAVVGLVGAAAGLVSASSGALAQVASSPGGETECCLVLLLPVGANSVALGRTLTARTSQDGAFANPAGLAGLELGHFMIHRNALAGDATAFSLLLTPSGVGTVGLSYQLLDFGEIETTDEGGMTIGTLSLRHHLLIASFATPLGSGLAAGLNYKFYQFRVGCSGTCSEQGLKTSAHAVDIGLRYVPPILNSLQLGIVASNIGYSPRRGDDGPAETLPLRLRVGATYQIVERILPELPLAASFSLEFEDTLRDLGSPTPSVGLELNADDLVFLRAGFIPGDGAGTGAAVGIGVNYTRFVISVAKSFGTPFSEVDPDALQVSFGISF